MLLTTAFRSFSRKHNTNLRGINRVYGRYFSNVIVTLDPNKFAEKKQRRLHIGNLIDFNPRVSLRLGSRLVTAPPLDYDYGIKGDPCTRTPYPPDTGAFLYYYMSPKKPRISGQLRLRVTSSDDPASFESGSDLLRTDGQPWSRPLHIIYPFLYQKLREDQLVPDDLDAVLSTLLSKMINYRQTQLLYTLDDTFIVRFSNSLFLTVITEQRMKRLSFERLFVDSRVSMVDKSGHIKPYKGRALARLERSTLPEHNGTKTVVLRFLKIITPVECVIPSYDGYICCPKEGELYRRTSKGSSEIDPRIWSVNLDRVGDSESPSLRVLQLLWDT